MDHLKAARFNIYGIIHKALRLFMSDTLAAVGSMDCSDAAQTSKVLGQVRDLAATCRNHFMHENAFVHAAMEARRPGSSSQVAAEHEHHAWAVAKLDELANAVQHADGSARQVAADALYQYLALFMAENFVHMNLEETANNEVLWATHTDAELLGIERAIVASQKPQEAMMTMRWMMPAMNASERAEKLEGMRRNAPAPVFEAVMAVAQERLPVSEWDKLLQALSVQMQAAA